jgi:hypothetical protein
MRSVGGTNMKYAFNRLALSSLWHVQARIYLTQIDVVALEEDGFLLLEKPRCPIVNQVGDDNSTPLNQPFTCAPLNIFGDGPSTHVYKPLDPYVWP